LRHSDGYLDFRHSEARGTSHLYWQAWRPDTGPRGAILLVHGLGEHSGRYAHVARACNERGLAVYAVDHYGHGRSDGQPGFVERFSVYLDGVRSLQEHLREQETDVPVFLLGHSMGGLIAAALLCSGQADFRACVLSGPAFKTDNEPSALLRWLNRLLSWLVPTAPMVALDPAGVSRDPEVVKAYVRDPLVFHGKLSARLIAEMMAAMGDTLECATSIELPILVLHGEEDRLTSPEGSARFCASIASRDKTLKTYPGLYHEIFNEPEKDAVIAAMLDWLEAHL
jgi:alpha-beta hydrolase superfamily lysophospholipase